MHQLLKKKLSKKLELKELAPPPSEKLLKSMHHPLKGSFEEGALAIERSFGR